MHKKGTGEKTHFSYKQKNPFFPKEKQNKTKKTYFYQVIRGNFERDVELDFRSKRTGNL